MKQIAFCFTIHQPFRLKRYRFFDLGSDHYYYDDYANEFNMRQMVETSIIPTGNLLLDIISRLKDKFRVSFAISGTALDQFQLYAPEAIDMFKRLADTGQVEFLCSNDCESLSSIMAPELFLEQAKKQKERITELFGQEPKVFCNPQLIYSTQIGDSIAAAGFKAVLTEGARHLLGWRSPNFVYCSPTNPRLKILLRNWSLSDDIGFRFADQGWSEYPLTAEKYAQWLNAEGEDEDCCVIALDYSFFGGRHKADTGIFDFLNYLPDAILAHDMKFVSLEEMSENQPIGTLAVNDPISWADEERDLTAWMGNELQQEALSKLYELKDDVAGIEDPEIQLDWKYLQTMNNFRFMSTKYFSTRRVFAVPSPYTSPYDAFINYMNILSDFALRVKSAVK